MPSLKRNKEKSRMSKIEYSNYTIFCFTRLVAFLKLCFVLNVLISSEPHGHLKDHLAENHSTSWLKITYKCKLCFEDFYCFYSFWLRKNNQQWVQIKATNDYQDSFLEKVDDKKVQVNLRVRQPFWVDSELEKGCCRVFKVCLSTLSKSLINDKLDYLFKNIKCAANSQSNWFQKSWRKVV